MKKSRTNTSLIFGVIIIAILLLWSFFPSLMAPHDPKAMFAPWQKSSAEHLLGTNDMGYDIYSELVFAASRTLFTGITAALFALVVGTLVGALSGYFDRWGAGALNMLIDIFLLIPMLPMCIVLAAFLGPSTESIILTIALLGWGATAKAVRAKTRSLKQTDFIQSLLILGLPKRRIVFFHIIPNIWDVVLARYIVSVASCILTEATISFIGLGNPINVTWGGMINVAFRNGGFTRGDLNWYLPPGICIVLCVQAFYCINMYLESRNNEVVGETQGYLD